MRSKPLVSVVIPTHNREKRVVMAVRSVLEQQGDLDFEVIVVDDASSDGTGAALQQFGDAITVLRSDSNIERGAARNLGVAKANGDLIAFLDADDLWRPRKLVTQISVLNDSEACVTHVELIDDSGRSIEVRTSGDQAPKRLPFENPFVAGPSSLLIKRESFNRVDGFPMERELQGSEDWIFFYKLDRAGIDVAIVEEPLVLYRVHATNSTADPDSVSRSMWSAVEWLELRGNLTTGDIARARARSGGVIAAQYLRSGRWREGWVWLLRSLGRASYKEVLRALYLATISSAAHIRGRIHQ